MSLTKQLPVNCAGHKGDVIQLAFSNVCESGYYLASASLDGKTMLRHGDSGDWVGTFIKEGDAVWSVDINKDATVLVTGGEDCTARIWSAVSGEHLNKIQLEAPVRAVTLSAKSSEMAVGCLDRQKGHCDDQLLLVYSLERLGMTSMFERQTHGVRDAIFCRDDRALLTSSHDRCIRLWDRNSNQQVHSIEMPHHAKSLEMCADERTVTIAYGRSVVFIDVERFEVISHRRMPGRLVGASLHPLKQTFVCAGINQMVYKCDFATGEVLEQFQAHDEPIRCIKYSPDGEVFATAANKGGLRLWQQTVGKKYALWNTEPEHSNNETQI
ncbi:serine-threonine kinase receptor-associated protein [Drosophila busckii]|uniref:serine-threonine kinase receptor-associated protein n=1 Tax=Drosophila busckii TaxID=30019 RepID=UPI001432B9AC|nr:serine-threonine kinase receptor-associated protein [Drosophila busckii]